MIRSSQPTAQKTRTESLLLQATAQLTDDFRRYGIEFLGNKRDVDGLHGMMMGLLHIFPHENHLSGSWDRLESCLSCHFDQGAHWHMVDFEM